MTQLTTIEQTQIRFHFAQVTNVTLDYGQALTQDYNVTELGYVQDAIASCETAFGLTTLTGGTLQTETEEVTQQDITVTSALTSSTTTYGDRTKTVSRRASYQDRLNAYHAEVEKLAKMLGVELW